MTAKRGEIWKQRLPSAENCLVGWELWARGSTVGPKQAGSPLVTVIEAQFMECLICSRPLSSCFTWIRSFNLRRHPAEKGYYHCHFTDWKDWSSGAQPLSLPLLASALVLPNAEAHAPKAPSHQAWLNYLPGCGPKRSSSVRLPLTLGASSWPQKPLWAALEPRRSCISDELSSEQENIQCPIIYLSGNSVSPRWRTIFS